MMRSSRLSSIVLLVLLCVTFTLASGLDLNGPKPKTTIRSFAPCPKACSNNGLCEKGVCVCQSGFSGPDCSQICPSLCSNHGQCVNGKCICTPGYAGEDCSIAAGCPRSLTDHPEVECSGHGVCHRPSQTCICRQGYVGKDCSIDDGSCGSAHCSNRGHCQSGQCHCDLGYSGEHCEVKSVCPNDCNGTGHCIGGTCHCFPGWSGIDCKTKDAQVCPGKNGGCSGNGICANGKCICSPGYAGESCAKLVDVGLQPFCAGGNNCTGNGVCANNQCFCRPGFYGAKCEKSGCPNGCGEHGHCSVGICRCQPGWGGPDCQTKTTCPNGCSGHGLCNKGQCSCEPYWTGADCSKSTLPTLACPKSNGLECGGVGQCFLGQCFCEPSFTGADCGTVVQNCPSNCGGPSRGTCRFGSCFCEPGFDGPGCEHTKTCAPSCEQHGICLKGECKCALGWTGADCDKRVSSVLRQADVERDLLNSVVAMSLNTPPVPRAICSSIGRPCSEHGLCVAGACVCEPGWGGQDCGLVLNGADSATCGTLGCGPNGQCAFGTCICQPGYSGRQCDKPVFLPCPNDCSSHGICYLGTCDCHPGFEGDDCSRVKPCENGCVRGACVQGNCECVHGWRGLNCSEEISQSELPEKSYLTPVGLNTCGLSGCGTHGVCVGGQCVCVEGYAGTLCELPLLGYTPRPASDVTPANPAVSDVFGSDSCTVNCGLHGVCIGGTCTCVDGWAGKKCTKSVPEVQSHAMFGAKSDFLSIMTLQKRAYLSKLPSKPAQLVPQANISFMESHSAADTTDDDDTPIQPKIFRNTAILSHDSAASAGSTDKLSYSPDTAQSIGADAVVPSSASNQVEINNAIANHPSETTYSMSMNPYLMSFLCFLTGVLVTITLKCLLDKRDQEKRKMQKMEELLQPAS